MSLLATREPTEQDVAKKRMTPPRNDEAVRIHKDVAAMARIAAAYAGASLADYISNALRPIVTRDINEGHTKISTVTAPSRSKKGEPPAKR